LACLFHPGDRRLIEQVRKLVAFGGNEFLSPLVVKRGRDKHDGRNAEEFGLLADGNRFLDLRAIRNELKGAHDDLLLLEKSLQEVVHKGLILAGKHQRDLGRVKVKTLPADLRLTFQAGEVETRVVLIRRIRSKEQNAFDKLSQKVLMVKRHMSTPVL